jgi:hypothetical protein
MASLVYAIEMYRLLSQILAEARKHINDLWHLALSVVPAVAVFIGFLGYRLSLKNREDAIAAAKAEKQAREQNKNKEISDAIAALESRLNQRTDSRSRRNLRFQMLIAFTLFLPIACGGGYLWVVTKHLEAGLQPELKSAAEAAVQAELAKHAQAALRVGPIPRPVRAKTTRPTSPPEPIDNEKPPEQE